MNNLKSILYKRLFDIRKELVQYQNKYSNLDQISMLSNEGNQLLEKINNYKGRIDEINYILKLIDKNNNSISISTDDLREMYGKQIHFNCKDGDEAFPDGYVLWLEDKLLDFLNKK